MTEESTTIFQVSEDDIKNAKEKFPDAKLLTIEITTDDDKTFEGLFRKPSVDSFRRYFSSSSKQGTDGVRASQVFVNDAAIVPTKDDYMSIAQRYPALIITLANQLSTGYGMAKDTKKKHL